jgi:hypothetical protein
MGVKWALAGGLLLLAGLAGAQVSGHPVASPNSVNHAPVPVAVKSAPFSADVITQYDRTLDNGGHIHRETRGKIFRDSQGRMRTDNEMPSAPPAADKPERVTISDPVLKEIINLNPRTRTATIFHFG